MIFEQVQQYITVQNGFITVIALFVMIFNAMYLNRRNIDTDASQINTDIGHDIVADLKFTKLSYNEAHGLELGIMIGIVIALTLTLSRLLAILLLLELSLMAVGLNMTATVEHRVVEAKAFLYTVRANPWYYLVSLVSTFVVTSYLIQKMNLF